MAYKKYGIYGYECSKCGKFVSYSWLKGGD